MMACAIHRRRRFGSPDRGYRGSASPNSSGSVTRSKHRRRRSRIDLTFAETRDDSRDGQLFIPFGALVALAFPGTRWVAVLAAGCLVSVGIELTQLAIPSRVATVSDVVANTAGAGAGLLLARMRRPRTR